MVSGKAALARLGERPYKLSQLTDLLDDAALFMGDVELGDCSYEDAIIDMIEMLEDIAFEITVENYTSNLFPDGLSQDASAIPWGSGVNIRHEMYQAFTSLLDTIPKLKSCLFQYLDTAPLIKTGTHCVTVCQYCAWALEKINADPQKNTSNTASALCISDTLPEFPALQSRSESGCEFCDFLKKVIFSDDSCGEWKKTSPAVCHQNKIVSDDCLKSTNTPGVSPSAHVYVWLEFTRSRYTHQLRSLNIRLWSPKVIQSKERWNFAIESTDVNLTSKFGIFGPPKERSLDLENLKIFRQKMNMETSNYNLEIDTTSFFPKRLIDLGSEQTQCPKLICPFRTELGEHTKQLVLEPSSRYAALSYCWGPESAAQMQLKLTRENKHEFLVEIPMEKASPIIRDTVICCRALGFRYLWIDAICIFQDDKKDWEEQSYEMKEIFAHAWICICTLTSSSCMEGFLQKPIDRHLNIMIGYRESIQIESAYSLRYMPEMHYPSKYNQDFLSELPPFLRDLEISAWKDRGWIYQERVLSKRKIYFGETMVHFQQDNRVTSESGMVFHDETFPPYLRNRVDLTSPFDNFYPRLHPGTLTEEKVSEYGRYASDLWYQLLEGFNSCKWTHELDVFPGLSGIASLFHQASQDQYLAGLWRKDLYCGLIWLANRSIYSHWHGYDVESAGYKTLRELMNSFSDETIKIAPSWSWAARQPYELQFYIKLGINTGCRIRSHLRPELNLLKASASIDGENPFGRIHNAALQISGKRVNLHTNYVPAIFGSESQQMVYRTPRGHCIIILRDWTPPKQKDDTQHPTGITSEEELANLKLLLISSCCSEWSGRTESNPSGASQEVLKIDGGCSDKRCTAEVRIPNFDQELSSHEAHEARTRSSEPLLRKRDLMNLYRNAMKPSYANTFLHDSDDTFEASRDCVLCADINRPRDVWGLLIHPAGKPKTYYRVGIFMSRAEMGGSVVFDNVEKEDLILI